MRRSWLRAETLGNVIGHTPALGESTEAEEPSPESPIGHVAQGPDFRVWNEDPREAAEWAVELSRAGGRASEVERWQDIAERSSTRPSFLTDELEVKLATWSESSGTDDGISTLGCVLCLLPSLDRTALICSCATSASEETRRALARALAAPFEAVGLRPAMEQLQGDASSEVRRLARFAAATRWRRRAGARYAASPKPPA